MPDADPLARACELVGRFLYHFARVESRLDEAITKLFKLDHETARVITTIDFFKKRNIVQWALKHQNSNAATPIESIDTTFSLIAEENDARKIMAHGAFEPDPGDDGVKFPKIVNPHWTEQRFQQHFAKLEALDRDLEEIVRKLEPGQIEWQPLTAALALAADAPLVVLTSPSHPAFLGPDEGWLGAAPQG
jgi:hypothetical protein